MRPLVGWLKKLAAGAPAKFGFKSAGLTSRLELAFYEFCCRFQVQLVGVAQKNAQKLMNNTVYCFNLFESKCRLLVLHASSTRQCILAYFPTENSLLKRQL